MRRFRKKGSTITPLTCMDSPATLSKRPRQALQGYGFQFFGEGKNEQLIRLYDHVRPDEVCPVFPSPSVNPRRADNLVRQYRELLFDRLRVEPLNFIYASEWNPFEVYRQVCRTIERYNSALDALGKCKVVVSALSSKLFSVGALLAAYEAKRKGFMIGISHVETHGYRIHGDIESCDPELYSLWIAGECYNA